MGCHSSKPSQPSSTIHSINTVRPAQAEPQPLDEQVCLFMRNLPGSTPLPTLLSIKDSIIKNQSLLCMVRDFLNSEISANNLLNAHMEKFVELKEFMEIEAAASLTGELLNAHMEKFVELKEFMEIEATASLTSEFILTRKKLLDKITPKIKEIKRKLRKSKKLKKITKIVVKVAFVTVSVVAIVLVAMSMPVAITTSITIGNNLIKEGGTWLDSAWVSHLEGLKGENDVLLAMGNRLLEVRITQELEKSICEMVNHLNGLINTRRLAIDSDVEKVAILNEIKRNIVKDMKDTEEIISQMKVRVEACNGEIRNTVSDFLNITVE